MNKVFTVYPRKNELPRSKLRGIELTVTIMFSKVVTPECFYRGSTVLTTTLSHVEWVGGPACLCVTRRQVSVSPGFPLKACGNDGL
jgi:hypothetical protein